MAMAAALAIPGSACAQWSGSLRLESDHRFRGITLSDGQPAWRLSAAYDHAGGAYAGVSLAEVRLQPGQRSAQWLAYAGFAQRSSDRLAWELGATRTHFTGDADHDYGELYAGLIGQHWNLRLYHAPDYFGRGIRTLYAEANGGAPLSGAWRWFAHVGTLHALGGSAAYDERRWRADARIGLAIEWRELELQAAWVGAQRGTGSAAASAYAGAPSPRRSTWTLSAALFF
jgi:uncharacterized protein (TIGR02001 family)